MNKKEDSNITFERGNVYALIINSPTEVTMLPAIYICEQFENLSLYPEKSGKYQRFVYLQGTKPEEHRLGEALIRNGSFTTEGLMVLVNNLDILYSAGNEHYKEFAHGELLSILSNPNLKSGKVA